MASYWLIQTVLVVGLILIAFFMTRPIKSASHLALRRIGVMLIAVVAGLSVIFQGALGTIARMIGVNSGVNLLVYILFIAVFTQMATSYRRDSANERKLTSLARAVALQSAPKPPQHSEQNKSTCRTQPIDFSEGAEDTKTHRKPSL